MTFPCRATNLSLSTSHAVPRVKAVVTGPR